MSVPALPGPGRRVEHKEYGYGTVVHDLSARVGTEPVYFDSGGLKMLVWYTSHAALRIYDAEKQDGVSDLTHRLAWALRDLFDNSLLDGPRIVFETRFGFSAIGWESRAKAVLAIYNSKTQTKKATV